MNSLTPHIDFFSVFSVFVGSNHGTKWTTTTTTANECKNKIKKHKNVQNKESFDSYYLDLLEGFGGWIPHVWNLKKSKKKIVHIKAVGCLAWFIGCFGWHGMVLAYELTFFYYSRLNVGGVVAVAGIAVVVVVTTNNFYSFSTPNLM